MRIMAQIHLIISFGKPRLTKASPKNGGEGWEGENDRGWKRGFPKYNMGIHPQGRG